MSDSTASGRRHLPRRKKRSPDGTMTLIEHLRELRNRVIKSAIFIVLGMIVAYIFYNQILHLLQGPYCDIPRSHRLTFGNEKPGDCKLLFTGPVDGFLIRLKVSLIGGVIVASPFWLYQIWAFITPGLKKSERKITLTFVAASSTLVLGGVVLAYFVIGHGLKLLIESAGSGTVAALSVKPYLSFVIALMLIFGVAFELPLLVVMLNLVGVLRFWMLKKFQRIAIFLIFVFAGFATPSTDPFTMLGMAVPMVALFEIAVLIAWRHDKRKAAREDQEFFHDLSDDEASPLDTTPSTIEDPDPVDDQQR
ncbi:MAG TPA: twin-arginine translocase subunit TatC [Mycobacteriales bacterium]|nr:twin-arginine translocase subunit TatC [Mycobacteriales bacterium]